jgi:hypothetical protein
MKIPFFLFLIIISISCKKENSIVNIDIECNSKYEITINANNDILCNETCVIQCQEDISRTRYDYSFPCFNPNDSEEFAYLRFDNTSTSTNSELWIYNYCNEERKMLYDSVLVSLDWSIKDWLIFTASNQMIYKIKSNGDSLTQLTFSGSYNRRPRWNPSGDAFFYSTQTGSIGHKIIATNTGEPIDTIDFLISAWGKNELSAFAHLVGTDKIEVGYYNISTGEKITSYSLDGLGTNNLYTRYWPSGRTWLSQNEIFWTANEFVAITNIVNGETEYLVEGYDNRQYELSDVSPDGKYAILNRLDIEELENCFIDTKHRLYLLDINAKAEFWIDIPE